MRNKIKIIGLLLIFLLLAVLFAFALVIWGDYLGFKEIGDKISLWVQLMLLIMVLLIFPIIISNAWYSWAKKRVAIENLNPQEKKKIELDNPFADIVELKAYCRRRFGFFWRYKVQKILVLGDKQQVSGNFADLTKKRWYVSGKNLLIYGGDCKQDIDQFWFQKLKECLEKCWFFYRNPLDAIVWTEDYTHFSSKNRQISSLQQSIVRLQAICKTLKWLPQLYIINYQNNDTYVHVDQMQATGFLFEDLRLKNINSIGVMANSLVEEAAIVGMQQQIHHHNDLFLLQLSKDFDNGYRSNLVDYCRYFLMSTGVPKIRGIYFAPNQNEDTGKEAFDLHVIDFNSNASIQSLVNDATTQHGEKVGGLPWAKILKLLSVGIIMAMIIGLVVSYFNNKNLIIKAKESYEVALADSSNTSLEERLSHQTDLKHILQQLQVYKEKGAPLIYRFGINKIRDIFEASLPQYVIVNERNIQSLYLPWMMSYFDQFKELPALSAERLSQNGKAYDVLKSYLMLGTPEHVSTQFLQDFTSKTWSHSDTINEGIWQLYLPDLMAFWGEVVKNHPKYAIKLDDDLVRNIRNILINQIGLQNKEDSLYQEILEEAKLNYDSLSAARLVGTNDINLLFNTDADLPGVFTREAWENDIKNLIDLAVSSRQEQLDWVLVAASVEENQTVADPKKLKQQITERYFIDYHNAWVYFLNNFRWKKQESIPQVIDQLSLLSDSRRSPLITLMDVVKYHSEVNVSGDSISDAILESTKSLGASKNPSFVTTKSTIQGPLLEDFAPLNNLIDPTGQNSLSLQTYLLKVTQLRLKLQNIVNSPNPKATAKILARSVFQGSAIDVDEARDYGNLIAANLGDEWRGFGETVFKAPLKQGWQVILEPATENYNQIWENQIAGKWNQSFEGRYPFYPSDSGASFAELSNFLRPDTGVIDRFIKSQLSGILEKQGDEWVVNTVNAQGLTFNPAFLEALNLLSHVSGQLLTSGNAKLEMDIMPRSTGEVVRTQLKIDQQTIDYFNQISVWQRVIWPDDSYAHQGELSWSSDEAGLRLYGSYKGEWGFLRLLSQAKIRQLDLSRYEVVWEAGENELKYIIRTQSGEGPFLLLELINFKFPSKIFLPNCQIDCDDNVGL